MLLHSECSILSAQSLVWILDMVEKCSCKRLKFSSCWKKTLCKRMSRLNLDQEGVDKGSALFREFLQRLCNWNEYIPKKISDCLGLLQCVRNYTEYVPKRIWSDYLGLLQFAVERQEDHFWSAWTLLPLLPWMASGPSTCWTGGCQEPTWKQTISICIAGSKN